jgi:hypothetical protein
MAKIVLGPIQRGLGTAGLRIWLEVDGPCEVEVLGHRDRSWSVEGHHYALVELDQLEPGTDTEYDVRLDGEVVWPSTDDDRPRPRIRSRDHDAPIRLVVGSCRQAAPPSRLEMEASEREPPGLGADALAALSLGLQAGHRAPLHGLVLLGDQVYADEPDPRTVEAMRGRRGGPPEDGCPEVTSFEEYTWLYQEAWSDPDIAWLLASVPSVMVFDDHDIIDDWNISDTWHRAIEQEPWWRGRIVGGLLSYWVYQHIGNVALTERSDGELLEAVRSGDDGALRRMVERADKGTPDDVGHRWSYAVELGRSRLLVIDSRNGRVLEPERRSMLGEAEWMWLDDQARGDVDHLFVASSVPWILPRAIHDFEAWNDALVGGAWGRWLRHPSELVRQKIDVEHWAAFGDSFEQLAELLGEVSRGERGAPPATITALSGDVHFGYIAEVDLGGESRVRQVVSSPFRQSTEAFERHAQRLATTWWPISLGCRALVATTPQARPRLDWDVTDGPWFDDHLTVLTVDGRQARVAFDVADLDDDGSPTLRRVAERDL